MQNRYHIAVAAIFLAIVSFSKGQTVCAAPPPDILYVGDDSNNTVRRFNAETGQQITGGNSSGVYMAGSPDPSQPGAGGLIGPRGLLVVLNKLFVVNQNVKQPKNGEVLRYRLNDGLFAGALVSGSNAPFAPYGMVYYRGVIYVTDFEGSKLRAFNAGNGKPLGEFSPPAGFAHAFFPRGIVVGPSGLLYVSNTPNFDPNAGLGNGGDVLVFDPKTLNFVGTFITDAVGGVGHLNRPEGLVFGPDDNLYITSFRGDATDVDSIRIYDGATGVLLDKINLDAAGGPRAFAQDLLFGPSGKLFAPIYGNGPDTGSVRKYDVHQKVNNAFPFTVFIQPSANGGPLGAPRFLTFGRTNPATLDYAEPHAHR